MNKPYKFTRKFSTDDIEERYELISTANNTYNQFMDDLYQYYSYSARVNGKNHGYEKFRKLSLAIERLLDEELEEVKESLDYELGRKNSDDF